MLCLAVQAPRALQALDAPRITPGTREQAAAGGLEGEPVQLRLQDRMCTSTGVQQPQRVQGCVQDLCTDQTTKGKQQSSGRACRWLVWALSHCLTVCGRPGTQKELPVSFLYYQIPT